MRPLVFLLALVVTGHAIDQYYEELIPIIDDTILHKNSGPSIKADVKKRPHFPGVITTIIPDPAHPSYSVYYVRDAAILHHAWLDRLTTSRDSAAVLRPLLDDAVRALIRTQHIVNPSGNVFTGGLEEPAFNLPLVQITDPGTRAFSGAPAADGPPSRATVLIKYAEWLTESAQNNGTWVADNLWPAIDVDLQWISLHWNQSSWDLWTPAVWGGSYWTASLQYRALLSGAHLGRKIERAESASSFEAQASMTFWNEKGFMSETTVTDVSTGGRSGIGSAPLTVSVINFDPTLGCDSATFQPCSERALSSLKYLIDVYRTHYTINEAIPKDQPVLIGGFLEDAFLGGGAQYFATFNSAEQLFDAVLTWDLLGELNVTEKTLPFFQQFDEELEVGTYHKGSMTYEILTDGITSWAKHTILLVSEHTPNDYVLPLSINGTSGEPYGPRGALRSLSAALTAHNAYHGLIPPSWAHGGDLKRNNGPELVAKIHNDTCGSQELFIRRFDL
ncbi:Six-hairpin glycosidase-like protein [Lactarius quietus]|nr:Six-hairpin glycosidase-like protein [Lactarius quietus]